MPEPTVNVIKCHSFERVTQCRVQFIRRAWLASAHQSLDLRPTVLNRREVGRISGQPQDFCFDRSDGLLDLTGLMHRQVIKQHDVFGAQLRDQSVTDIRIKDHRINRTFNREWCEQPAQTQTPDQSHCFAMIARHALVDSLSTRCTTIGSGQGQMKACFVGKDKTAAIQASDSATKGSPVGCDPLRSSKAFFYEAGRASVRHGRQSRDGLQLWPSFSSVLPVQRAWRLVAGRLGSSTTRVTSHPRLLDSRRHAEAGQGSDPRARASSFWPRCNDPRQTYQRLRQVCLRQFHKPAPVFLVSQWSTPSFVNEWRKSQYQCKRKAL
jgi:hypothetical protein